MDKYNVVKVEICKNPENPNLKVIKVTFGNTVTPQLKYLMFEFDSKKLDIISREVREAMHKSIEAEVFKESLEV